MSIACLKGNTRTILPCSFAIRKIEPIFSSGRKNIVAHAIASIESRAAAFDTLAVSIKTSPLRLRWKK